MESKRRHRDRRPARHAPRKLPKRRLLVVCEGKVTEPDYIRGYERLCRNATVEITIPGDQGVPLALVRKAVERWDRARKSADKEDDSFLAYDEVWCVFDVDEHPGLNDAVQLAVSRGIELAISNPCFELWLLLHFRESPGPRHRRDLQRMLRTFLSGYDKHLDFADLAPGVEAATRRARRLDDDAERMGAPRCNPTTGVYRLMASVAKAV